MMQGIWEPYGLAPNSSGKTRQKPVIICTADVQGQFGGVGRCGTDISRGGSCPCSHLHMERPVPFSFRSVYRSAGDASYYFNGVWRKRVRARNH